MSRAEPSSLPSPPLLLISDRRQAQGGSGLPLEAVAAQALAAGCKWLLLREKDLALGPRRAMAAGLRHLTRAQGARLLLSNDIGLAREIGADGVHLSRDGDPAAARDRLGPSALVGRSAHGLEEARSAFERGADYVTLSPVFSSASKPGYGPALGLGGLQATASVLSGPVIALGGVTAENGGACLAHGAKGLAVMGEVMRAARPGAEVAALLAVIAACSSAPR